MSLYHIDQASRVEVFWAASPYFVLHSIIEFWFYSRIIWEAKMPPRLVDSDLAFYR